jgi:hypothetical protein
MNRYTVLERALFVDYMNHVNYLTWITVYKGPKIVGTFLKRGWIQNVTQVHHKERSFHQGHINPTNSPKCKINDQ